MGYTVFTVFEADVKFDNLIKFLKITITAVNLPEETIRIIAEMIALDIHKNMVDLENKIEFRSNMIEEGRDLKGIEEEISKITKPQALVLPISHLKQQVRY